MADGVDVNTESCLNMIRERLKNNLPASIAGSRENEQGERFIPVCCDSREYLEILRGTKEYGEIIDQRFQFAIRTFEKTPRFRDSLPDFPPPTREEVIEVYESDSPLFKELFWNFYQEVLHLSFAKERYSKRFNEAFSEYQSKIFSSRSVANSGDVEDTSNKDFIVSQAHNKAAMMLVEDGVSPNEIQARMIIRAFLLDLGMDTMTSARKADFTRQFADLPDDASRRYLLKQADLQNVPTFSAESKHDVHVAFEKKHPDAPVIDPSLFTLDSIPKELSRRDARSGD